MPYKPVMTGDEVMTYLAEVFPQSDEYRLEVIELGNGSMTIEMTTSEEHLRPGGTVSGPTMFALADVAAYVIILAHIGKVALAVTTSLNINFMAKPVPGRMQSRTRLIKLGKRLAVCEIHIYGSDSENMVAQATATYSIPVQTKNNQK